MSKVNVFVTIRERHHSAARLIASGLSPSDVAHMLGTSEAQLIRQIADPAFRDLVARYRDANASPDATARFRSYSLAA